MKLILYCDGASRGNPGPGAYGFLIKSTSETLARGAKTLGNVTNNVAEYHALIEGLKRALTLDATELVIKSDSELLVRQLNGQYRIKAPNILPLYQKATELLAKIKNYSVTHVPREENKEADRLANLALDGLPTD